MNPTIRHKIQNPHLNDRKNKKTHLISGKRRSRIFAFIKNSVQLSKIGVIEEEDIEYEYDTEKKNGKIIVHVIFENTSNWYKKPNISDMEFRGAGLIEINTSETIDSTWIIDDFSFTIDQSKSEVIENKIEDYWESFNYCFDIVW